MNFIKDFSSRKNIYLDNQFFDGDNSSKTYNYGVKNKYHKNYLFFQYTFP